jgi:hypothetical protein
MPPPKAVKTVRDLIYWEYAHLIAKGAGFEGNYAFIMNRYQKLKKGEIKWSDIVREDRIQVERGKNSCVYCGSTEALCFDHLIPVSRGGPNIISNQVVACKACNSSKGNRDIFEWYTEERKEEIPGLVKGKYLKLVFDFHEAMGTLDLADINADGKLDVMDLGAVFRLPYPKEGLA